MSQGDTFSKLFARRKLAEQQSAAPAADSRDEKPKENPFNNFWNIDDRKGPKGAAVTVVFFLLITMAMDAVIFIPFGDEKKVRDIMEIVSKFPPSLFAGLALLVIVMIGRDIDKIKKIGIGVGAAVLGYFAAFAPLIAMGWALCQPLKGETVEVVSAEPAPAPADESPAPEPEQVTEPPSTPEPESTKGDEGTGEAAEEDFADPLAEFINKD